MTNAQRKAIGERLTRGRKLAAARRRRTAPRVTHNGALTVKTDGHVKAHLGTCPGCLRGGGGVKRPGHMPNPDPWITGERDDRYDDPEPDDDVERCYHGVPFDEDCEDCLDDEDLDDGGEA